jgi:hypothetical protein
MKLISDDVLTCVFYLNDMKRMLEQELMEAKDLLSREDLPEPHDRFKLAWSIADAIKSDLGHAGDVGLAISDLTKALEALADELPDE